MKELECPLCTSTVRWQAPALWVRCPACEAMVFEPGGGPAVLVAHESEEVSQQLGAVVRGLGANPLRAADGNEALHVLQKHRPVAAVLDVALGGVTVFEIIDTVRSGSMSASESRIVLVASVFNKTAYKRSPTSLYGADDYVEQHHIPDKLPVKLARLLGYEEPAEAPRDPAQHSRVERIARAVERRELRGPERGEALAHSIVADIALYHEADVAAAARGERSEQLERALAEGRRILAEMVASADYPSPDPITDAFNALLEPMRNKP